MPLAKPLAVALFLVTFLVGAPLTLYGLFAAQICLDPGGCRPDPIWVLALPGVGLVVLSGVLFHTTLRSRSKPS